MNDVYPILVHSNRKYSINVTVEESPTRAQRDKVLANVRQMYSELGGDPQNIGLVMKSGVSPSEEIEIEKTRVSQREKYLLLVMFNAELPAPSDDELQMIAEEFADFYEVDLVNGVRVVDIASAHIQILERAIQSIQVVPNPFYDFRG